MIVKWFLDAIYLLVTTVLGVIPNLPAMDSNITNSLNYASTVLTNGVGFVKYFYGGAFFNVIIGIGILLINFDVLWNTAFFIIRKIPMLGVKE